MFLGRLETRSYEWATLALSVEDVLDNLKSAWMKHQEEDGVSWTWEDVEDAITITPLHIGDTVTNCHRCENLAHR